MYAGKIEAIPVPKPENGSIRFYKSGYVYYISETKWDKEKKHSTDNRTPIGKLVEKQNREMMYPNHKYFEIFGISETEGANVPQKRSKQSDQLSYGAAAALLKASEKIGCTKALETAFPKDKNKILALAIYTILAGEMTAQKFEFWFYHNYCPIQSPLTSGEISVFYEHISELDHGIENFMSCFKDLYNEEVPSSKTRVIGFDSTNQNTASSNKLAAHGHAKKNKGLPVVNTAMFVDELTGIPLYYEHFTGSIMDKSETPYTLKNASRLGFEKLFAMMDRGYFSRKTVDAFIENDMEFGIMVPDNAVVVDSVISSYGPAIKNQQSYWIGEENVYGCHLRDTFVPNLANNYDVYLFYDDQRAGEERKAIHQKMEYLEKKVLSRKRYSDKLAKQYEKWFEIEKTEHNANTGRNFTVKLKNEPIQEELDEAGMFLIVSNAGLQANEMIQIARHRDRSEKAFRRIKSSFDMDSPHTQLLETYEAKMFISYIALIIEEAYRWYIKDYLNKTSSITTDVSLGELSKYEIRRVDGKWHPVSAATRKQKEIWRLLGMSENDVMNKIEKLSASV